MSVDFLIGVTVLQCDVKLTMILWLVALCHMTFIVWPDLTREVKFPQTKEEETVTLIFVSVSTMLGIILEGYFVAHYTELKSKLRKNMTEYFNLVNRLGEGVLILAKDSINEN